MNDLDYSEIIEDTELKTLIDRGFPVTFRVIEDEWNADYTVRTIKRVEIDRGVSRSG
jgi:hypothetical protein